MFSAYPVSLARHALSPKMNEPRRTFPYNTPMSPPVIRAYLQAVAARHGIAARSCRGDLASLMRALLTRGAPA